MTITANDGSWNRAHRVIFAYAALSLLLVYVPNEYLPSPIEFPLAKAIARFSSDPGGIVSYFGWMSLTFPVFLALFSKLAPMQIEADGASLSSKLLRLVIGFTFFGLIVFPTLVGVLLMVGFDFGEPTRFDGLFHEIASSRWNLFYAGTLLYLGAIAVAWIAYVAAPVAVYRLLKAT